MLGSWARFDTDQWLIGPAAHNGAQQFLPKMTVFSTTRSKRRTAFMVLMAWLFALVSGLANACLLEAPAVHSTGAQVAPSDGHHPRAEVLVQHEAAEGHGERLPGSKESCLKACDDGTHTSIKAPAGVDQTDPGPASFVTTLWPAAVPVVLMPHRAQELHVPLCEPPLRVRYSRLML